MITLTQLNENEYFIDGKVTNDDFFLNTDSEHLDPADAAAGKDAAVYSVPVSLKQSVLDELAKSKHLLASGVIGSFECTRLIQLVSMRIDVERTMDGDERVITPEACEKANRKLREWRAGDMTQRVEQIKRQLRKRLDNAIHENNRACLQKLKSQFLTKVSEVPSVAKAQARVDEARRQVEQAQRRLDEASRSLADEKGAAFLAALADDATLNTLPDDAREELRRMTGETGEHSRIAKVAKRDA